MKINCERAGLSVVMDSDIDGIGQPRDVESEVSECRELVSRARALHKS